jgi:riboflavin-specific deaminase-like protein
VGLAEAYEVPPRVPFLRANFVASLDGSVEVSGTSHALSSPGDREVFRALRGVCDAVLVGAGTVRAEGYRPIRLQPTWTYWRRTRALPLVPRLAVVSGSLQLDLDRLTSEQAEPPIILTTASAPAERRRAADRRAELVAAGEGAVNLGLAVRELRRRGLAHILCEGGPSLLGSLLEAGLVDELCLSIAPLLCGPGGKRLLAGPTLAAPLGFELTQVLTDGATLFVRYRAPIRRGETGRREAGRLGGAGARRGIHESPGEA